MPVNCDNVNELFLESTVAGKWEDEAHIPIIYPNGGYFWQPFVKTFYLYFQLGISSLADLPITTQTLVKKHISEALGLWRNASQGKYNFVEQEDNLYGKGITVYFADKTVLANKKNALAFAQRHLDNSGFIQKAAVVLPQNEEFWQALETNTAEGHKARYILLHELGHALGFQHVHDNFFARFILQAVPNGEHCTVMAYPELVAPVQKFYAHNAELNPPYPIKPGSVDERLIKIQGEEKGCPILLGNCINSCNESVVLTGVHTWLESFLTHFALEKDKPLLSKNVAALAADVALLGTGFYLQMPPQALASYAMVVGAKYFATDSLGYIKDYHLANFILNTMLALRQGSCPWPMFFNTCAAALGTMYGAQVGTRIGTYQAKIINPISQNLAEIWKNNKNYFVNALSFFKPQVQHEDPEQAPAPVPQLTN